MKHKKNDLIDVKVGKYDFSLKENSFILDNMGLYKYLNIFTKGEFKRGIHIFNDFAKKEYNYWFNVTWKILLTYLNNNKKYCFINKKYTSSIFLSNNTVILNYNENNKFEISEIPCSIHNWDDYMNYTTSKTREKVFAKWISEICSNNYDYLNSKKLCSNKAGENLIKYIKKNLNTENIKDFLQIHDQKYYYAKTTNDSTMVFLVPSKDDFHNTYEVKNIEFSVPSSQLNIITTITNKITHKDLIFRNECRFSHGQFNGTPEAKMYYDKGNDLSLLYTLICNS